MAIASHRKSSLSKATSLALAMVFLCAGIVLMAGPENASAKEDGPRIVPEGLPDSPSTSNWTEVDMFGVLDVGDNSKPAYVDLDNDGDLDLVVGASDGTLKYFKNLGDAQDPIWDSNNPSMFTGVSVSGAAAPTFGDLDGDGDYDLLIGKSDGYIIEWENTGDSTTPIWTSLGSISDSATYVIDVGDYSTPFLANLNSGTDSTLDLVIGNSEGKLIYYRNSGSTSSPTWSKDDTMFSMVDIGSHSVPMLGDRDGDGDRDLLIGGDMGIIIYYKNIGSVLSPKWELVGFVDCFEDGNLDGWTLGGGTPSLDNYYWEGTAGCYLDEDGEYIEKSFQGPSKLFFYGYHYHYYIDYNHYLNIYLDGNLSMQITQTNVWVKTIIDIPSGTHTVKFLNDDYISYDCSCVDEILQTTPDFFMYVGGHSAPTLADVDGDGDLDLTIGEASGNLNYFENTDVIGIPTAYAGSDQAVSQGTTVLFDGSGSSDPDGTITSYQWTFTYGGNLQTLTGVNPSFLFDNSGSYTVTLTVTDNNGNSDTDTVVIAVTDMNDPVANAGVDGTVEQGESFTFDGSDSSDNVAVTTYTWTFTEGTPKTLTGVSPTYIFSTPGIYIVTLTVSDAAGNTGTDTITITVLADSTNPYANAGMDQTIDKDETVTFNGGASTDNIGVTSYVWTFVDGVTQTLTGAYPAYTFHNAGVFTVTLMVEDAMGNADTDTMVVTVNSDTVDPVANAGDDQSVYAGNSVTFNGGGSSDNKGVVNYTWTFTDGTSQELWGASPSYTFTNPGAYTITLTVSDEAGNTDTDTMVVTATDAVLPTANAGADQTIDEDTSATFDGSLSSDNVGISSYTWTFTDNTIQVLTGVSPTYTFETPGTYSVNLTVTDAGGNCDYDTFIITVRDVTNPVANAGLDRSVNEDVLVTLNAGASTDNANILRYTWSFVDGTAQVLEGGSPSQDYTFSTPGTYEITLKVMDTAWNNDTDILTITVNDVTPPAVNAGADVTGNVGMQVIFDGNGSSDNGRISNYSWTFTVDGSNITLYGPSPSYVFDEPGTYVVNLTVIDDAGNVASDTVMITVKSAESSETSGFFSTAIGTACCVFSILLLIIIVVIVILLLTGAVGVSSVGAMLGMGGGRKKPKGGDGVDLNSFYSYKIGKKLGQGGFSRVYQVTGPDGNQYAMKIPLDADPSKDETIKLSTEMKDDFVKEARTWMMLVEKNVPNILHLYAFDTNPFPWFVMDVCDGSLESKMRKMSFREKCELLDIILRTLNEMHFLAVVHRDIKPQNVLYKGGKPLLSDFGLGKEVNKSSKSSQGYSGTLEYSAPEQFNKKMGGSDRRTDVWQTGILAYNLFAGIMPFTGTDISEVMYEVLNSEPPHPSMVNPEVPRKLGDVIMKAIAKRKEDRWQSAEEMRKAIKDAL